MRPTRPFILLLLLAVLIPGADTLRAARPYRPGFLYREGPHLMLDGKPYRSASFNACQFSGCGHPYELLPDREIDSLMATLPPGMLIRTWAFPGSEDRTARLLQMADRHGHKLLLTLGDGRSSCGHHDGARDGDGSGKRPEWYADGYRREYLPHVRRMVEKFKDARGVGMWEILNEAGDADWRVIKRFYDTAAAEIKRIDPDHLVSTGSASSTRGPQSTWGASTSTITTSRNRTPLRRRTSTWPCKPCTASTRCSSSRKPASRAGTAAAPAGNAAPRPCAKRWTPTSGKAPRPCSSGTWRARSGAVRSTSRPPTP